MSSNNKNKLNGTYIYHHKHNYIPCSTFTVTKVQLHVSTINVGHLQVVHEELISKLYQLVWGVYSLWGGVGARSRFVFEKGGMDWGCFGDCVKPFMSTYSYVYKWVTFLMCTMYIGIYIVHIKNAGYIFYMYNVYWNIHCTYQKCGLHF